jgi:hypothetical protein
LHEGRVTAGRCQAPCTRPEEKVPGTWPNAGVHWEGARHLAHTAEGRVPGTLLEAGAGMAGTVSSGLFGEEA